uniref:Ribosomal protein S8 n=1 Tax=Schizocladia ischiensis TaxID=196139 RepID=A0A7U3RZZ4_9STRA|nr:ribosomal protein S8 [Schizocladia ischiensis]QOW07614.1 ribosomal protein S8 [Schizocladia ischiensis]
MQGDRLSNMLSGIRNGLMARKPSVLQKSTKTCLQVLDILWEEGYIQGYSYMGKGEVEIVLKYRRGRPVMKDLGRISRPGRPLYLSALDLYKVHKAKLHILVVATPQGLLEGKKALKKGQGGEVLCYIK